jgi:predicted ribosome quality control (RQC) complex YloA/Tae2 family protein
MTESQDMIEFITDLGSVVLVGKNASENEKLTMKDAKGSDMFFHACIPGAHVILKSREGIPFKPKEIEFAADVAGWWFIFEASNRTITINNICSLVFIT